MKGVMFKSEKQIKKIEFSNEFRAKNKRKIIHIFSHYITINLRLFKLWHPM